MNFKDLEQEGLLKYISKKKDDEHKMMSMIGITIGAIVFLIIKVLISSLDDIPNILKMNNWLYKFLVIFTLVYNLFCSIFFILNLKFHGNNRELKKKYKELPTLLRKYYKSKDKREKEEIENKIKEVKKVRNEIDRETLVLFQRYNIISLLIAVTLNVFSSIYLAKVAFYLLFFNILLILSIIVASFNISKINYKIGSICFFCIIYTFTNTCDI